MSARVTPTPHPTSTGRLPQPRGSAERDTPLFRDRREAGRQLGRHLRGLLPAADLVVLGLTGGGVPVAAAVAGVLDAPLDVIVVRKLGLPGRPELAMGAVDEDGFRVLNQDVIGRFGVSSDELGDVEAAERRTLHQRTRAIRAVHPRLSLLDKVALVVDDGLATGATARAACAAARALGARRVVLAVPIASQSALTRLYGAADQIIALETPSWLSAVGQAYEDFSPVPDQEVLGLLGDSERLRERAPSGRAWAGAPRDDEVTVLTGSARLPGHLTLPPQPIGLVLFAHGSGSGRHSPRNQYVARVLNDAGIGTLLFDLLTPVEASDPDRVFDVEFLASRLFEATAWARSEPGCDRLPVGYFGASTGAAAALLAAAHPRARIRAVVSRGGRPELALRHLAQVEAPTLLVVGGADRLVMELNRRALSSLTNEHQLMVVPGATHLFEEPGALEQVARLARDWFAAHLPR